MSQCLWTKTLLKCIHCLKIMLDLQSPHGLRVMVSFHFAGHQQLGGGRCYLFSRRDELLLTGMTLHWGIGCFTQVTGGGCYHTGLCGTESQRKQKRQFLHELCMMKDLKYCIKLVWDLQFKATRFCLNCSKWGKVSLQSIYQFSSVCGCAKCCPSSGVTSIYQGNEQLITCW